MPKYTVELELESSEISDGKELAHDWAACYLDAGPEQTWFEYNACCNAERGKSHLDKYAGTKNLKVIRTEDSGERVVIWSWLSKPQKQKNLVGIDGLAANSKELLACAEKMHQFILSGNTEQALACAKEYEKILHGVK